MNFPLRRLLCLLLLVAACAAGLLVGSARAQTFSDHGSFWLYEPPASYTGQRPVVVYFHGAGGQDGLDYLLSNLARRGYYVIMPIYFDREAAQMRDEAEYYTLPNYPSDPIWPHNWYGLAIGGMFDGLMAVGSRGDLNRLALAGHSLGGLFAAKAGQGLSNWGLPPRAIILHDGAGYTFTPMLTSRPRNLAELLATYPSRDNDLGTWSRLNYDLDNNDNFSGIRAETMLVSLNAQTSYVEDFLDEWDGGEDGFGNSNIGGVSSHVWHTARSARRHALVVLNDPGRSVPSNHVGVATYPYRDVYYRLTRDALAAAFAGRSWSPDPGAWSDGTPKAVAVPIFAPRPFVWSCRAMEWLLDAFSHVFPFDVDSPEIRAGAHEFLHHLYLPPNVICY